MDYQISVPTTKMYAVDYRIAARNASGGIIQLQLDGSNIGSISLPSTGAWQTYTTVSNMVNLSAGTHTLRVFAQQAGWNLNWIDIHNWDDENTTTTEACDNGTSITYGHGSITMSGGSSYQVFDKSWNEVFNCGVQCGNSQTVNNLPAGDYQVLINNDALEVICQKVISLSASNLASGENTSRTRIIEEGTDSERATPTTIFKENQKDISKIAIFPNPATDKLFFNMNAYTGKQANLFLFDHLGRQLLEQKVGTLTGDLVEMNTDHLQNGLYYTVIEIDSEVTYTQKIIIHRVR